MTEAVHIAMIPVILLATVRAMDGRSRSSLPGLATGLLFLVRSTALFILPVQALFLWKARGWRAAAAVVAGFILCAAPWVARNRIELGSPILLPTKGSLNLWMRNNPEALALEDLRAGLGSGELRRTARVPRRFTVHDGGGEKLRAGKEIPRIHD